MKKIVYFLLVTAILISPTFVLAQSTSIQNVNLTVSGSNLIKIMNKNDAGPLPGTTSVSLSLSGATEAGAAILPVARDTSTRMRMSCLTANTEKRKIYASITENGNNFLNKHTTLQLGFLTPDPANLNNFTNYGDADDGINTMHVLADNGGAQGAVTLIQNMTTSWTGTNVGDGYLICYDYSAIAGSTPQSAGAIKVTFTISAQ